MSTKHLAKGSTKPPLVEGKLRLYSMEFCPYVHRIRLVLLAKQIPHDIVNIHLKNKPDWYFDVNPTGTVPAIDTGNEIVTESLDIADYLDQKYPEPPLYPDPTKRSLDLTLIKNLGELFALFSKAFYDYENKPFDDYLQAMKPHVLKYENELQKRGLFFGGNQPGMVDYMLWPWAPRAQVLKLIYNKDIPGESEFPALYRWCDAMRRRKEVKETDVSLERLYKLNRQYVAGPQAVDYDNI